MNRNKILEHLQEYGVCNEAIYYIKNLEKEIERLKDQLQQKENIIKEVRETVKWAYKESEYQGGIYTIEQILDKE